MAEKASATFPHAVNNIQVPKQIPDGIVESGPWRGEIHVTWRVANVSFRPTTLEFFGGYNQLYGAIQDADDIFSLFIP